MGDDPEKAIIAVLLDRKRAENVPEDLLGHTYGNEQTDSASDAPSLLNELVKHHNDQGGDHQLDKDSRYGRDGELWAEDPGKKIGR